MVCGQDMVLGEKEVHTAWVLKGMRATRKLFDPHSAGLLFFCLVSHPSCANLVFAIHPMQ